MTCCLVIRSNDLNLYIMHKIRGISGNEVDVKNGLVIPRRQDTECFRGFLLKLWKKMLKLVL